jgi:Porin PorA
MRTSKIVLLVIGVIVLAVAAIWRPVVAPQLTKLPTSLDIKYHFTGTYTGRVNQSTSARLAAPQNLPLSIDRQVKAVPTQSTSSELVVNDASAVTIGPDKTPQVLQYVLDRSTAKNVKSPYAYALVPGNVVDRAGSYSLGPPPGADTAKTYPMWVDEIGKTVPITYANVTQTVHGVAVQEWQLNLPATPMAISFASAMHLPMTMSFAELEAQLKAQGSDLALGLKILSGSLTAAEKTSLAALTAKPIPLQYFYATSIKLLVEPASGTIVDTLTAVRAYSVRPVLVPFAAALAPTLAAHPANPAAAPLTAGSKKLTAASAQPLYTLTFHQTPASVTTVAGQAGHNADLLQIVEIWIPIGLGVIGLILVGLAFTGRWRREPPAAKPTQPGPQTIGVA